MDRLTAFQRHFLVGFFGSMAVALLMVGLVGIEILFLRWWGVLGIAPFLVVLCAVAGLVYALGRRALTGGGS